MHQSIVKASLIFRFCHKNDCPSFSACQSSSSAHSFGILLLFMRFNFDAGGSKIDLCYHIFMLCYPMQEFLSFQCWIPHIRRSLPLCRESEQIGHINASLSYRFHIYHIHPFKGYHQLDNCLTCSIHSQTRGSHLQIPSRVQ